MAAAKVFGDSSVPEWHGLDREASLGAGDLQGILSREGDGAREGVGRIESIVLEPGCGILLGIKRIVIPGIVEGGLRVEKEKVGRVDVEIQHRALAESSSDIGQAVAETYIAAIGAVKPKAAIAFELVGKREAIADICDAVPDTDKVGVVKAVFQVDISIRVSVVAQGSAAAVLKKAGVV